MAEILRDTVEIDGRRVAITGSDDGAYLQEIADYINGKIEELRRGGNYGRQTAEDRRLMLLLNIADDYYREKKRADEMEDRFAEMEEQVDHLRLELVHHQMKRSGDE